MFSTSAKTILDMARMFSAGRRGIFPLGDGDAITVMHHMWELNRRKYDSSRDYYQAVEDLSKRIA